jgi:hypothetical protein
MSTSMTNQYKDIELMEYSNQQALSALKLKTQFIEDSCYTRFHLSTEIETKPDEALDFTLTEEEYYKSSTCTYLGYS